MARLKVTGYLNSEDFSEDQRDESTRSGLTEETYEEVLDNTSLFDLEEVEITAEA